MIAFQPTAFDRNLIGDGSVVPVTPGAFSNAFEPTAFNQLTITSFNYGANFIRHYTITAKPRNYTVTP